MPEDTTASAISRIREAFTRQPNLFHEFQPIGGVFARPLGRRSRFTGFTGIFAGRGITGFDEIRFSSKDCIGPPGHPWTATSSTSPRRCASIGRRTGLPSHT
jgi:hypothetical protein